MDSVILFPYCLERSTNVKKGELKKIECPDLIKAVDDYEKSIEKFHEVAEESVKGLEYEYGRNRDPEILKAKRKITAGKLVSNKDKLCDAASRSFIENYNLSLQKKHDSEAHYRKLFTDCLEKNRYAMREFIENNGYVLQTLPLINKDFIYKLKKYLEVPVEQHNAKIRKLDHRLIRLFTRATMKTSPFSYLTSTCLYDIEKEYGGDSERMLRSICETNNYILKAIYDFIAQKKSFAKQLTYRLNAHKAYGDSYVFLFQKDYERGKVYKTVDGTVKMSKKGIFELVVDKFKDKVFSFDDLLKVFTDNGVDAEKASDFIYNNFILNNIITPDKSIDDTKDDIYQEFYSKVSLLKDDEKGTLREVLSCVKECEKKIKEFEHTDWTTRFVIVDALDTLVTRIESILKRQFVHNILLYEDTVYEKPRKPVYIEDLKDLNLKKLQKYFRIFDQSILTYILFSEQFYEKYGDERVVASDLDVYKLFVESASKLTNVWKDNFSSISVETGEKIKKISSLKKNMYSIIQCRKEQEDPQDIKDFIDQTIDDNPDIFDTDIDSATFFFQKTEEGEIVLNKVYKGQLLFFTRFLKLFSENSDKIQEYCQHAFGPNPMEITESFGFNANVHKQIFDKRLVLNLTDKNDSTDGDISIDDCFFYFDHEKNLVKLVHDALGEVNGVYLGSLAYNLMPIPLRTINGMQPTTRFDTSYLNLWNNDNREKLIADHIPRMQYDKIVFMRERYLLNSIYDLKKPEDELYLEILEDFKREKLPLRFFIRPYINGEDFDFYNMGRTSLKPQYIDLSSPLLFQELLREMENQKQFVLEEIYPDNHSDDYIYEYEMEQTLYR